MSVWKSDEKLLGFASLISPSKIFFWRSNIEHLTQMKLLEVRQKLLLCASYFIFAALTV